MKNIYGYNPNQGFIYIDLGDTLISVQAHHSPGQLGNWFSTLPIFDNYDKALSSYLYNKENIKKPVKKALTGIDRQFKELEATHMGSEFEDDNYNNMY
tara:strand:+ start:839 stop:1132 length:294 start_codon:yes stop_codon:yes gene_type:complete